MCLRLYQKLNKLARTFVYKLGTDLYVSPAHHSLESVYFQQSDGGAYTEAGDFHTSLSEYCFIILCIHRNILKK